MPISTIMLVTVGSACTRWDSGAVMPIVTPTLVTASRTGIPAAISAPNASSISRIVTGRLITSADARSSAIRSLMASSMVRSPASWMSRSPYDACTSSATARSGAGSSWSRASCVANRSAERSGLHCGSETLVTPSTARSPAVSSAVAASAAAGSSDSSAGAVISTFSVSGSSRPASAIIASARPDSPIR